MAHEVIFPKLGLDTAPGRIVAWLKTPGDAVARGEPILEVETDKTTIEVEAPADGVLLATLAEAGEEVAIGSIVAFVGLVGEDIPIVESQSPSPQTEADGPDLALPLASDRTVQSATTVRASPAARRRAKELALDLIGVVGSGPEGRITPADVERHAAAGVTPSSGQRTRRAIAEQVTASWEIPHINIGGQLDADPLAAAIAALRKTRDDISVTDFLIASAARALASVPELNGTYADGIAVLTDQVHLGLAVATMRGVMIPVIRNAHQLSLEEIAHERIRLRDDTRRGVLRGSDAGGATATLSNLGAFPVDFFTPIIFSPQISLIATGRITLQPTVLGGDITTVSRMWVNVAIDHRAADGETGGKFLAAFEREIERVSELAGSEGVT